MPNNITNRLEILGNSEQVKAVRTFLKGKNDEDGNEVYIDFNNIVRMPECLDIPLIEGGVHFIKDEYNRGDFSILMPENEIRKDSLKEQLTYLEFALNYESNIKKSDQSNWYSWRITNWGTKWNAFLQGSDADNAIHFCTANDGVPVLMEKLSKKFPEIKFKYSFSDYYDGRLITYLNGEIDSEKFEVKMVEVDEPFDPSYCPF